MGKKSISRRVFPTRGTYAITPADGLTTATLLERADAALCNGIRVLQYRSKSSSNPEIVARAKALREICRRYDVPLIINDDIELAFQVDADGVHLGKDDADYRTLARDAGRRLIIGVSCYDSLARAREAVAAGVDYIAFGRFFPSTTKPHATPCSQHVLFEAAAEFALPIVAIGGITPHNGRALLDAGATMLATADGIFGQTESGAAARGFQELFDK